MADKPQSPDLVSENFVDMFRQNSDLAMQIFGQFAPEGGASLVEKGDAGQWAGIVGRMQKMWLEFQSEGGGRDAASPAHFSDPAKWLTTLETWYRQMPLADAETQKQLWEDGLELWQSVLGQYGIGPKAHEAGDGGPVLPRSDPRFSDPKWREQPFFALVHQTYLLLAEQVTNMAEKRRELEQTKKERLQFVTRALVDAMSPSNFPLTNPLALDKAAETQGESLIKGLEHLIADLRRGQLTHSDPKAFRLGENIAVTPGKVVYETPLFQLIQYTPTTEKVLAVPVVIFPPWINRFYILDLNAKKSFVRWAVSQGLTVFMVSWKSADATMGDIVWDDYIAAQIEAIDVVRKRLKVPAVHTIGYCVAGTTLAATLAVLARKGAADKVKSATFFTAQVDFEEAGELKNFIDDQQIEAIGQLAPEGYLDGRYMASAFNLLRGNDLIWSYVVKNYLLGEDYSAFDLLHWNGDVTNLPLKWHRDYLRDLYRDNRMVIPDSLSACGVPLDLRRIETPCYIQAGREDHIAPPQSVWKLTRHLSGSWTYLLAGSGHIAGVVNPPEARKYQYWTNDASAESLGDFIAGATEHPGSWWPHWIEWLRTQDSALVAAKGKRKPGGKNDKVIEDAPGRYVQMR